MERQVAPLMAQKRTICAKIIWLLEKLQMFKTIGMIAWTIGLFTLQLTLTIINFVYNTNEMNPAFSIMNTVLYIYIITVTALCPLAVCNVNCSAGRGLHQQDHTGDLLSEEDHGHKENVKRYWKTKTKAAWSSRFFACMPS